jgi:hypothetical protein
MTDDTTDATDADEQRPGGNDRLDDHVAEDEHEPALKESAESFRDALPSTPDTRLGSTMEAIGRALATGLLWPFQALASIVITALDTAGLFIGLVPLAGTRMWRKFAIRSIEQYDKAHSGDVTGFVTLDSGEVKPYAVEFQEGDDDQKPGWTPTNGWDKVWHEGADGREVDTWGRAKVIWLDESAHQRATPVEARFANALAIGKERVTNVFEDAQLTQVSIQQPEQDGAAIADGGVSEVTVDAKGALSDSLVDIGPEDDYDGTRVSVRRVKETYRDNPASEQMELNEDRAYLAGLQNTETPSLAKILLYVLGIVAAATMGPPFVTGLFSEGGGSGGGGGLIPFVIDGAAQASVYATSALAHLPTLGGV